MERIVKKAAICFLLALCLLPWPVLGTAQAESDGEITAACTYILPAKVPAERLTDESLLSRLTVRPRADIRVGLPACSHPSLYVTWFVRPRQVKLEQLDEKGKSIRTDEIVPGSPFERYELDAACRQAILSATEAWTISTLRVFDGELPEDLPYFGAPMEQADLLIVMGQPQALFEELGGLASLYMGQYQVKTAFCYLNEDNAVLQATAGDPRPLGEALSALWSMGYKEAPFLGGFLDHDFNELEDVQKAWTPKDLEAYLVGLIRTLRPKVVVCAAGGEEDQRSAFVAGQIEAAVSSAADGGRFAEVGKAHKVQKLYLSDPEGKTLVSYADVYASAVAAYRHVASRQFYKFTLPREGRFTLVRTSVGQDKKKNDLLEN
ncbi:MAG: hypothetical protein IJI97_02195, partial [Clostridia bacterium]|nr:hypothetical protein [Clostridia bacterium]